MKQMPHVRAFEQHIANAQVRQTARGILLRKADKASPQKIGLAVCAVMAHSMATKVEPPKAAVSIDFF